MNTIKTFSFILNIIRDFVISMEFQKSIPIRWSNLPIWFAFKNISDMFVGKKTTTTFDEFFVTTNSRAGLRTSTVHLRSRTGHHTADLKVWCQQSALQFNPCSFESHFMVIYWIRIRVTHWQGEQLFSQLIIVSWFVVCETTANFRRKPDKDIFSLGGILPERMKVKVRGCQKTQFFLAIFPLVTNFLQ